MTTESTTGPLTVPTSASPPIPSPAVVETALGRYRGLRAEGLVRFLGIRYATAERFAPPEPTGAFDGVQDAVEPAPACPQPVDLGAGAFGNPYIDTVFDEDCLRVSITAPGDVDQDSARPVLVWLHGGSYTAGGGDLPIYDPAALVREQRVVVVAVTYRLGVLGFLGDGERIPANLGLLDQTEALRWVRANIAAFGGDPECVTVFGQSAGADAIAHLLLHAETRGLFRRILLQSPPLGLRTGRARMTRLMVKAAGVLDPAGPVDTLFPAQIKAGAVGRRFGFQAGMPFGTQYGHAPLPEEAHAEAAWREAAPGLDVLIGWTREETALFGYAYPVLRFLFALPVAGRAFRRWLVRVSTDAVYRRECRRLAAVLADAGARVTEYELDWQPKGSRMGAAHAVELPLLFPTEAWRGAGLLGDEQPASLLETGRGLRQAWAAFARTGRVEPLRTGPVRLRIRRLR
jgi:para-nitrobenzyl esterase